jgi:hypothetical protein
MTDRNMTGSTAPESRHVLLIVPIYVIGLDSYISFTKCTLLPGVVIRRCTSAYIEKLCFFWKFHDDLKNFPANMVAIVDSRKYFPYLQKEISDEGRKFLPRTPIPGISVARLHTSEYEIKKHLLISLLLVKKCPIQYLDGTLSIEIDEHGNQFGGSRGGRSAIREVPYMIFGKKDRNEPTRICPRDLKKTFSILHPYYRGGLWINDRVGVALGSAWGFLRSEDSSLGFLSLVTLIEALVGTERFEMTHQICERVAISIKRENETRIDLYCLLKKIYDLFSKFVHGSAKFPKGIISHNVSIRSTKFTNVSYFEYSELVDIAFILLSKLIYDNEYTDALKTKDEDKLLQSIFLKRLLS